MLAGHHVPDDDIRELAGLLRDQGMEDVAHKLDHALLIETMVLALTVVDRGRSFGRLMIRQLTPSQSSGRRCSSNTSGGCVRGSRSRTSLSGDSVPLRLEAPCPQIGGA